MLRKILTLCILLISSHALFAADDEISVKVGDNIQQLLSNDANSGKTLVFEPGTYELNLELTKNISLKGRSTKDTIFKSDIANGVIILVNGATGISIQNITFVDSFVGIKLADINIGVDVKIKNNVFNMGLSLNTNKNTAILMEDVPRVTIENNVFYKNDLAIVGGESFATIKQNIFYQNTIDIDNQEIQNVTINCFNDTESGYAQSAVDGNVRGANPQFIDEDNRDFHLPKDSDTPCIVQSGVDQSLIIHGAYGGDGADDIPAAMEIKTFNTDELESAGTVTISWDENKDRLISGYKAYYSNSPLKSLNTLESRENLNSVEANKNLTVSISGLDTLTPTPSQPQLNQDSVVPGDRKLTVTWQAVSDADSYLIYYTGREDNPIEVKDKTSYVITGLSNDQVYTVWIAAKAQLQYYFQVVAYTDANSSSNFAESFFINDDKQVDAGEVKTSIISSKISQQPEAIVAYPVLPNEGCFIATAAYGYYSADEVMVLRRFRDNYLIPSEYGKAFVDWYYANGPYAADLIRQNELAKGVVRLALFPVVKALEVLESSSVLFFVIIGIYGIMLLLISRKLSLMILRKV